MKLQLKNYKNNYKENNNKQIENKINFTKLQKKSN